MTDNEYEINEHKVINRVVIIKSLQVLHHSQLKPVSDIVHYSAKFKQCHNASINKQGLSRNPLGVKSSAGQRLQDNFTITISMANTWEDRVILFKISFLLCRMRQVGYSFISGGYGYTPNWMLFNIWFAINRVQL